MFRCWFAPLVLLLVALGGSWAQQQPYQQFSRIEGEPGDLLGFAMTMSGATVVAGAPGANKVYVIEQNDLEPTVFNVSQILEGDSVEEGDFFGGSLAMTENRLVVGAFRDDSATQNLCGSVYVFDLENDGITWTQSQYIPCPGPGVSGFDNEPQFGRSVDITSDGTRIIVGAFQRSDILANQGSAFIYELDTGSFVLQQEIIDVDGVIDDNFGRSVSIEGDAALVGAFKDRLGEEGGDGFEKQGTMHHFQFLNGNWERQEVLTNSDAEKDDNFGNVHGLDQSRLAVGVPLQGPTDIGAVYLYIREASGLNLEDKITPSDGQDNDIFGYSLQLQGDKLLVGSPSHASSGISKAGAAYLYWDVFGTNEYLEFQKLEAKEPIAFEQLGASVVIDGDYIAVGANHANDPFTNPGVVYVFGPDPESLPPSEAPSLQPSVAPTQGFDVCATIYKCEPLFNFWPFNRGPKTYVHRFRGQTNGAGEESTCQVKCIFESNFKNKQGNGWECGACLF